MIYSTIIGIVAGLSYIVYFCVMKYLEFKSNTTWTWTTDVSYYFTLGVTWLVIGCIVGVILLIVLLLVLVLIKRLRIAIQLIREASKAVTSVFICLFFPFVPLSLEILALVYFMGTAVYLSCSGTALFQYANSSSTSVSCSPSTSNSSLCLFYKYGFDNSSTVNTVMYWLSQYQYIPHIYNFFMFFWVEAFIVGFNQMVLAGSFGIWYWSQSKSSCIFFTSLKDTMIFHLGSVAFGSLLIAIVKIIRYIISYIEKKLKNATGQNAVAQCIITFVSCCCKCCFWCLEKFLKFISKNAYIMVAVYGRNFCKSAMDAMGLLMANPLRAMVLDCVTDFILFLGRLLITAGVGILGFFFFTKGFTISANYQKYFAPDLQ
jgi:choline transporter-like protein 2/4/5